MYSANEVSVRDVGHSVPQLCAEMGFVCGSDEVADGDTALYIHIHPSHPRTHPFTHPSSSFYSHGWAGQVVFVWRGSWCVYCSCESSSIESQVKSFSKSVTIGSVISSVFFSAAFPHFVRNASGWTICSNLNTWHLLCYFADKNLDWLIKQMSMIGWNY